MTLHITAVGNYRDPGPNMMHCKPLYGTADTFPQSILYMPQLQGYHLCPAARLQTSSLKRSKGLQLLSTLSAVLTMP